LSIRIGEAGAVTREDAGRRKIRKRVDAGHRVACGQNSNLLAPGDEKSVGAHRDGINAYLTNGRECRFERGHVAGFRFLDL
jgi:hypothetical protein